MSTSRSEPSSSSPGSKRRGDSTDKDRLTNRTSLPLPLLKKTNKPFRSAAEKTTAYWDNLSRIFLCSASLKELDRRAPPPRFIVIRAQPWLRGGEITEPSAELQRACRLDLQYLRGYSSLQKASAPKTEMDDSGVGIRATNNEMFGVHLEDDATMSRRPNNWREIQRMLITPRPHSTPSASQFRAFKRVVSEIVNENDVQMRILPIIEGDNDFYTSGGHEFSNLKDLTDGSIAGASPDLYDGAYSSDVNPEILKELDSFINPLKPRATPMVPNFFAELKDPDSIKRIAEQEARYAGAIGARAIHEIRSIAEEDPDMVCDGKTYTITAIYHAESLRLSAHTRIEPSVPGGRPTYHVYRVGHYVMDSKLANFREAVIAFRNAREWAMKTRDEFIAAANARMQNAADK